MGVVTFLYVGAETGAGHIPYVSSVTIGKILVWDAYGFLYTYKIWKPGPEIHAYGNTFSY